MRDPVEKLLEVMGDRLCSCGHPESQHEVRPATAVSKNRLCMQIVTNRRLAHITCCSCMNFRERS